ncbi:hypothetical protein FB451DRAFT_1408687 [Mycena latifolia]|nr:hypothetical protein FB451DRAFT_1408687 [Mycena latifolia]
MDYGLSQSFSRYSKSQATITSCAISVAFTLPPPPRVLFFDAALDAAPAVRCPSPHHCSLPAPALTPLPMPPPPTLCFYTRTRGPSRFSLQCPHPCPLPMPPDSARSWAL